MSYALTLAGIAAVHILAAMSPGPAFVMVSRTAVAASRPAALAMAVGVGNAALLWATASVLGLGLLFAAAPWLYGTVRFVGGAWLLYLGFQAFRHAADPLPDDGEAVPLAPSRAWWTGFSASLANPKMVAFFGSIFSTLLTPDMPLWVRLAALAIVAVDETLWYALVVFAFSGRTAQRLYRRAKAWVDRTTGTAMTLFGLRLLLAVR